MIEVNMSKKTVNKITFALLLCFFLIPAIILFFGGALDGWSNDSVSFNSVTPDAIDFIFDVSFKILSIMVMLAFALCLFFILISKIIGIVALKKASID